MRLFFVSITLFVVAMFVIPVGGMCESNANRDFYMYGFLGCEILCVVSIVRVYLIYKRK
jgi:MFS-type transporter involved in bile tolerance (Atg22 family)